MLFPVVFGLIIVGIVLAIIHGHRRERQRVEALARFAAERRWRFAPAREHGLEAVFPKVPLFSQGHSRYASNVLRGDFSGHFVEVFDYHYAVTTSNGKTTTTHHYYFSCYVLRLPVPFPWLNVGPEGFLSKVAQAFGYDDIDFESAEFSRKYCVRSGSKKFAYGVLHPGMMEHLLVQPGLYFSISGGRLLMHFKGTLEAENIPSRLNLLLGIRERMPEHLFDRQSPSSWN